MSKEDDKRQTVYKQLAMILNYQPKIEHQHIHMGNQKVEDEPIGEEAEFEEVKEVAGCETTKHKLVISETEVAKSFRFQSEFVKKKVSEVIRDYYKGSHANLALIEITLYDHKQLIRRNYHKAFVKALVAWGFIEVADEEELNKVISAVIDKHRRMPKDGYQKWGDKFADDKSFCDKIGKELGDSMPYYG